ncbi:hypothetical protein J437_LFUL007787 [Ladona fulva]|uniref:ATP-dependent DNA helicase n=1 Tax=Ladona fulva TaxID=123851 RepID=A0A8K0NU32_LADFU|nr:hypothetical protein J437_LFUL007787 [Ladona fulva]
MPSQLRHVFSLICIFCNHDNACRLWDQFKKYIIEDYYRIYDDRESANRGLIDVDDLMIERGSTCADYGHSTSNRDRKEDNDGDQHDQTTRILRGEEIFDTFDEEHHSVVDEIIKAIEQEAKGKAYTYKFIIHKLFGQKIVLLVAWTGIAANLLLGSRTVHSTFKFVVPLLETPVFSIRPNGLLAEKLKHASLIVWD